MGGGKGRRESREGLVTMKRFLCDNRMDLLYFHSSLLHSHVGMTMHMPVEFEHP